MGKLELTQMPLSPFILHTVTLDLPVSTAENSKCFIFLSKASFLAAWAKICNNEKQRGKKQVPGKGHSLE